MLDNKIYFEEITPEMIVAYFPDEGYTAKSMTQLNQICSMEYSDNFELETPRCALCGPLLC